MPHAARDRPATLDGRPDRATELAVGCADRIESNEPGTAARLLAVASFASMPAGDGRSAYALADRAERLALPVGGPVLAAAQAARAQAEVVRGQTSHGTVMLESSVRSSSQERRVSRCPRTDRALRRPVCPARPRLDDT